MEIDRRYKFSLTVIIKLLHSMGKERESTAHVEDG